MPWNSGITEALQKRIARYVIKHYLGRFIDHPISLEDLTFELVNGRIELTKLDLDVITLNKELDEFKVPFEIVEAYIDQIVVILPWRALLAECTSVTVHGLELRLQPKKRSENGGMAFDSMLFNSMTKSMQLAREVMQQGVLDPKTNDDGIQCMGMQDLANTIDKVLSKIQVQLFDTIIRLEHMPKDSSVGTALEIKIARVEYFGDLENEERGGHESETLLDDTKPVYEKDAVTIKNIRLTNVSVFCDELKYENRPTQRMQDSAMHRMDSFTESPEFTNMVSSHQPVVTDQPTSNGQIFSREEEDSSSKNIEPVLIMELGDTVNIKMKLRRIDSYPGAKLEMECRFGTVNAFLTPRLLHILTQIADGIVSPGLGEGRAIPKTMHKKMDVEDFQRVEQELQRHLPKHNGTQSIVSVRQHLPSTSDDGLMNQTIDDDNDYETDDLFMSLAANSMESSAISSVSGMSNGAPRRKLPTASNKTSSSKSKGLTEDLADDTKRMKLRVSFLAITILHEDPAVTPNELSRSSSVMDKLREMSDKYFNQVRLISAMGVKTAKDLAALRDEYSSACQCDHLGLLIHPLAIELTQQSLSFATITAAELNINRMEIVDAVFNHHASTASIMGFHLPIQNVLPDYCELLTFSEDENLQKVSPQDLMYSSMQMVSPCVRMHFKSTEFLAPVGRSSQNRYVPSPKVDVKLEVGRCKVEVDITLVDRIHAILNLQSSGMTNNTHTSTYFSTYQAAQPEHSMFSQTIDDEDQHSRTQSVDFQLNCTSLTLDIRFPKVDLSSHRVEMPWWQRSLHPEHLFLCLESAKFQTIINNNACPFKQFEITCRSGEGSFQLDCEEPTLFIRIGTDDLCSGEGFDWPRMMIRIFPEKQSELEDAVQEKEPPMESEYPVIPSEALPFSSKKAMYENKPLVMPGDRRDMMDFQDKSLGNTLLSIELSLPSVAAFLPNKAFFEIFYNRLLNDLLLWEPAAPIPMDTQEPHTFGYGGGGWSPEFVPQMMQQGQIDATSYCTESTSESDGSEEFYPMDLKYRQQKRKTSNDRRLQPSKMCLTLNIGKGSLTAYAPLKDEKNLMRKDVFGEFVLDVEESCFLAVVGHGGDPELQYICCQIHRATLMHSGQVEVHCSHPDLDYVMRSRYQHLERIFYLSDDGIPTRLRGQVGLGGDGQEDMLSLTIKVTSENFMNQKKYLIAAGLRGTTLRHLNTPSGLSWFDQVTDFFNVVDFDIPGYTLPKIVTEMHLYAWSCAIDYRPLYLPYKALVVFELFSFASNVIAETSTSTLRFLLDDAALYLSDKVSVERVDVKRDYVCVVDVGMCMLSVQMSDGEKAPKIDLVATNNIFNIRTCSDSFTALAELINYLANRGDLAEEEDFKPKTDINSVSVICSQPTSPQALTQTCMEHLPDLMADAMQDLPLSDHETSSVSGSFDESDDVHQLYFQPTVGQAFPSSDPSLGHLSASLSSSSSSSSSRTSSRKAVDSAKTPVKYSSGKFDMMEDEFLIIDEPGFGTKPRTGEPTVRILTEEPIIILDNHFHQPINKTDLLKAPEHFPPAVYRYTLKEISIVWHMFGGRDFESSPPSKFSTSSPKTVRKKNSTKDLPKDINWQARGGRGRDINTLMELHLNKVRVQHEVFPDSASQVSRQVLLINEIEIRDRLAVSDINKFLYLYTSTDRPRQSHANMLVIKALHVRPDLLRPEEQECMLKVTLRPVRLNIDQDALSFLRTFSAEISSGRKTDDAAPNSVGRPRSGEPPSSHTSTPKHILPTMGGLATTPAAAPLEASQSLMTFDEIADAIARASEEVTSAKEVQKEIRSEPQEKTAPIFFKSFVFTHEVLIHLDYHGKRVDMEQGTLTGLVVGLAQLKHSELRLKRLNMQCGLLGVDRLVTYAINEWLQDIKKNQLPSLLGGVGPMHSLVQLVQGCIDLFWLPVEQYRRDGRIVRGLQRGANSFMTCTAMSALELTNRVVMTVQFAAETAHDMVSSGPSVQKRKKTSKRRKGLTHPADLREGVANAYSIVKEGLCETASNIYVVAVEEHEHKGVAGAIGGIIRQFPSTVIKPLIFTTEATSNVLGGMRNQLHPEQRKEDEEKWKTSVDSI